MNTHNNVEEIALKLIVPSRTNYKSANSARFSPEKIGELVESIKEKGIMNPLLVRPLAPAAYSAVWVEDTNPGKKPKDAGKWGVCLVGGAASTAVAQYSDEAVARKHADWLTNARYEIVFGERRFVAAPQAALEAVPCMVRDLTDDEALELQIIENLQRENPDPMEEAQGFFMLKERGNSVEEIARKIGCGHDRVYQRLKLIELPKDAAEAVISGKLPPRTASLIGRLPSEKMREQATKEILTPKYTTGPLSFQASADLLQRQFMCETRGAPFDLKDAALVPVETDEKGERCFGGACSDCPFLTGNSPHLFGDVGRKDMCTLPKCYAAKRQAHWKQWQDSVTDKEANRRGLSETECKRIFDYDGDLVYNSHMVKLKEKPSQNILKKGAKGVETWKKLTAGRGLEIMVGKDEKGRVHEVVDAKLAIEAAKLNEHKIFSDGAGERDNSSRKTDAERIAEAQKEKEDSARFDILTHAVLGAAAAAVGKLKSLPVGFLRHMAIEMATGGVDGADIVLVRRGICPDYNKQKERDAALESIPDAEVSGLVAELALVQMVEEYSHEFQEGFEEALEALGVDFKAVKARVDKELENIPPGGIVSQEAVLTLTNVRADEHSFIRQLEHATLATVKAALDKLPAAEKKNKAAITALSARRVELEKELQPTAKMIAEAVKIRAVNPEKFNLGQLQDHFKISTDLAGKLLDAAIDAGKKSEKAESKSTPVNGAAVGKPKKGNLDAAGRAKIVAALKARWAASKKKGAAK